MRMMMIRNILLIILLTTFCANVYAQKKNNNSADKKTVEKKSVKKRVVQKKKMPSLPSVSAQAQYTDSFRITNVNFTKDIDYTGKGEVLEVQFTLKNWLDDPQDIYLFVIATFEKTEETQSSFEMPIPEKERLRSFVPFPNDIKNFQYEHPEKKGKLKLFKFPKNPKAGVNPDTGKAYHLVDKLNIWTHHLSKYRNNYFFFNEAAILIFSKEGKLLYKQMYKISGVRH